MKLPRAASVATLLLLLLSALALAWLSHDAPLEPAWSAGLLRADGLSALLGACTALLGLAERRGWRVACAALLLCGGYLATHLAALGAALVAAALVLAPRRRLGLAAAGAAALGLALVALRAGAWRYPAPLAGLGLNSVSFALLLLGALLAAGAIDLPGGRGEEPPPVEPLLAAGCLYALLRLFALGPWNLGWLYAAMLLGAAAALAAAGRAAAGRPGHAGGWLSRYYLALGVAGAGMASGAGVALAGFALLALAALRLALPAAQETDGAGHPAGEHGALPPASTTSDWHYQAPEGRAMLPRAGWQLWLVAGVLPFTAPFTAAWAGVAGALAGGLSLLAAALWAAALLAALPIARAAESAGPTRGAGLLWGAGLSMGVGVGAPAVAWLLVEPAVAQLQAGLSPFGELALWPWAGLIALSAARQPVATLPSLALAALMLVLGALGWAVARLLALRGAPPPGQD